MEARAAARAAGLAVKAAEAKSPTLFCRGLKGPGLSPGACPLRHWRRPRGQRPHAKFESRHDKEIVMKPTFPILVAAAVLLGASSAEAARLMAGNSNIIIAPTPPLPAANQFRGAEYAAAARNASSQYRGNRHHEPERAWRPRPANLRRAAGQSGIGHLRSERSPAQFGQLWVSNCPGPGVLCRQEA